MYSAHWILITLLNKGRGLLDVDPPTSVLGPSNLVAACYFLFHFIFNVFIKSYHLSLNSLFVLYLFSLIV